MKDILQGGKTRELLIKQSQMYPDLQIRDVFKFLYQSSFGCEHMVDSCEKVTDYIRAEFNSGVADTNPYVEALDGGYSRVSLSYLKLGLSAETLGRLFFLSAEKEADGEKLLKEKLAVVKNMAEENIFSFSAEEFEKECTVWQEEGCPAVHHSQLFRENHSPSYRVIANRYIPFLPLLAEIDKLLEKGRVRLAVEGSSASGKTTLGEMLREIYGCTILHTDDFFLQSEQRTPERYKEIGGNIDRERFLAEVLIPLNNDEIISYRRFDCSEMKLQSPTKIIPEKLTVIEGAYSMHPDFEGFYDFSVFLDISEDLQKVRILKRNSPGLAERFFNEWIPLEKTYFNATDAKKRCTMCIAIDCI